MPELPDISVYRACIEHRVRGHTLDRVSIRGPSLLRTFEPPVEAVEGREVTGVERLGKRIVLAFRGELFVVLHLMIAGRLLWKPPDAALSGKIDAAALRFGPGTLVLTEASTRKRAGLWIFRGRESLRAIDPGGMDPVQPDPPAFAAALRATNRTLKRALTDPRTFSGIGNAYSDEVLHAARLSPFKLTGAITHEEADRLCHQTARVLADATARLFKQFKLDTIPGGIFPKAGEITAFRPEFAVHGKFGQPCPVCSSPVQRIIHAENEINYCATCQTGGKVLADRSLSRLLKDDWPRTIEEWEDDMGGPA
jgi:formamidopyrimidine-DNA glycosylase